VKGRPRPNFRLTKLLFIREASASFEHTLTQALKSRREVHKSQREMLLQQEGDVVEDLGLSLGYILVMWCATLP
jgi:hypothetical protein